MSQRVMDLLPNSETLLGFCCVPCGMQLECSHICKGTCGECLQGRIHVSCQSKCSRILICGHSCSLLCAQSCSLCVKKCEYSCKHSKCDKKCGEPCTPCKKHCNWMCQHLRCTKLCHEICNREPCYEPCPKKLKCKHPCIGFCGDPCPPLCRVCDKEEVFLGMEDEEDARFVYLKEDCGHVLESQGLEIWLKQSEDEITMKTCPRCKCQIMHTQRYMNFVKQVLKDVIAVKKKVFSNILEIDTKRKELLHRLKLIPISPSVSKYSSKYKVMYDGCIQQLQTVNRNRRNYMSQTDVESLTVYVDVLVDLNMTIRIHVDRRGQIGVREQKKLLFHRFDMLLTMLQDRNYAISAQETADFNLELLRFVRMAQLRVLNCLSRFISLRKLTEVEKLYREACALANCIERYCSEYDTQLKKALDDLRKAMECNSVSIEADRREIVKAMGIPKGHWFKCPNGHYYTIGNCGGSRMISKCTDCGTNHQLPLDNQLATEIDGATRHTMQFELRRIRGAITTEL